MPQLPTILTSANVSPTVLAEAVEANMAAQFAYFGRSPLAEVQDTPELLRYYSGIPISEYNGVIRACFASELAPDRIIAHIDATIAFFTDRGQSFFWWLGSTTQPPDLADYLIAAGFAPVGDDPGMAANLQALPEDMPAPPGLDVARVADARAAPMG